MTTYNPNAQVGDLDYRPGSDWPPSLREVGFSNRFRKVSNRYPRRVTEAYEGDLDRAMADSDEQVAATVAAWETSHGLEPRDWTAIGAEERDDSDV